MATIGFVESNLFKKDFEENYNKLSNQVKKTFENTIETYQAQNIGDLSCYSSDYEDEEIFTNKNTLKLTINNEEIEVPADIVKIEDVKDLFNVENFQELFDAEEQAHLLSLLPEGADKKKILQDLFSGKQFYHTNPLEIFFENLKAGTYTKTFQKEKELETRLSGIYLRNYYNNVVEFLDMRLEEALKDTENHYGVSNLMKRSALIDLEDISQDSDISVESINDVKVENSLEEISEGETVIEQMVEEVKMDIIADIEDDIIETRKADTQRVLTSEVYRAKKPEVEPIMVSAPASKSTKVTKNILTIKLNPKEWIERYREQERDRYNNPTRPWIYQLPEGSSAIVAPVAKKISTAQNSKPREHFLLKADRPSFITILCLVRDAAARLPSGEGTRADICELLKESQYINETIADDKLSTVVSGALDRLHYEDDPCVKYDSDKKLWIYLHRDRTEEYGPWIDQTDSRSSKKKEYNMKYKANKKLKAEDKGTRSETDTGDAGK